MRFFILFIAFLASHTLEIPELDEQSFESSISQQKFAVILFYTPFCAHSSEVLSNLTETFTSYYASSPDLKAFKVNAMKERKIAEDLQLRGFPSIKLYRTESREFEDWKWDITKQEMRYFLDLTLFGKVFFIGDKEKDPASFQAFKQQALDPANALYTFSSVDASPQTARYFFIPENEVSEASFILLRRRYDNFDKRLKLTLEVKAGLAENLKAFLSNYSHPFYIEHFNHRIRNYLTEKKIIAIGIFYRKKTKIFDSFILNLFRNMTRNYILELKYQEDRIFTDFLDTKSIVFTFLDTEEPMVRRLTAFMGIYERDLPMIMAYQISKTHKRVLSHVLNRKFQESPYYTLINNIASMFLEQNQAVNFPAVYKPLNKSKDSRVYDLDPSVLVPFLKLYQPKEQRTMHLIEYSASFCLHSKKLSALIEKIARSEVRVAGVYIYFGRMQLYGSDFTGSGVEKVPGLRLYIDKERYFEVELESISERTILEGIEKIITREASPGKTEL